MTTSNIANRLRRLEAIRPKRDEFDGMNTEQLRAFIGSEVRALLPERGGSVTALLEDFRTAGIEMTAEDIIEFLEYGLPEQRSPISSRPD